MNQAVNPPTRPFFRDTLHTNLSDVFILAFELLFHPAWVGNEEVQCFYAYVRGSASRRSDKRRAKLSKEGCAGEPKHIESRPEK